MACTFAIICDHYFAVMRIKKRWLVLKVTTNGPLVPGRLSGMLRTDKWMICTQNPLCKRVTISSYYHSSIKCFFFTLGKVHLIWQGGEDEDIEGGFRKFLDTRRGDSEKIVALGGGAPKICILQNQHMTLSYRSDGFQLNNLMTCATQQYHVVYRYTKCSL